MFKHFRHVLAWLCIPGLTGLLLARDAEKNPLRPEGREWPPVIGAWFWHDNTLDPDGYKQFLDVAAAHSPYTLLSSSLRVSKGEVIDPLVRDQISKAVLYAHTLGLGVAFDFDIRLARRAFQARYPGEQQEELVLKIIELPQSGTSEVTFEGRDLSDHMTGGTIPYQCLTTRLVRVYSFVRDAEGVVPETIHDITDNGVRAISDGLRKMKVIVSSQAGRCACVIAAHQYLTPDVFAPHLISFQREIVRQFKDLPLAGLQKDEWGFPPDHKGNPDHDRYWYSEAMAREYAQRAPGRDLVRDAMLMFTVVKGREHERQAAINRYRKLCRDRNVEIEDDYYRLGKETFGPESVLVTHATWTPYPGAQEFRKNGLDWWEATRDIGQTDESAPYQCRTALAKRWGYPVWYNQYYSSKVEAYNKELWANALSGGRVNFHPLYPRPKDMVEDGHLILMQQRFMTGLTRLRMLDFITRAPIDCPVAVIFGHACAMNWAGPSYNRVGLEVASALCSEGYLADLIPSSLAGIPALKIDADGYVCLGPQRYRAVVLYQPEFGEDKELAFFQKAAAGKSALFLVGDWTRDDESRPLDAMARLGGNIRKYPTDEACTAAVKRFLHEGGVTRVTGWSSNVKKWGHSGGGALASPPTDGQCVLTDGTYIRVAGSKDPAGDPIVETFSWQGQTVTVDAVGLVAIRLAPDGKVTAFAAGGLKNIRSGNLAIDLSERADVAFQTDSKGKLRGVVQGLSGPVPEALLSITRDWQRLAVPPLYR
ncbi:MAG: hypothetical protein A2283_10235 [Lentisphaerae bacterium RIFOXYA12_FULL_48_11]|nr:MAG: hypothetical protein A2283_10235 [Lentisphaerae bacterium RIFOXYA12_FULL_48_11]